MLEGEVSLEKKVNARIHEGIKFFVEAAKNPDIDVPIILRSIFDLCTTERKLLSISNIIPDFIQQNRCDLWGMSKVLPLLSFTQFLILYVMHRTPQEECEETISLFCMKQWFLIPESFDKFYAESSVSKIDVKKIAHDYIIFLRLIKDVDQLMLQLIKKNEWLNIFPHIMHHSLFKPLKNNLFTAIAMSDVGYVHMQVLNLQPVDWQLLIECCASKGNILLLQQIYKARPDMQPAIIQALKNNVKGRDADKVNFKLLLENIDDHMAVHITKMMRNFYSFGLSDKETCFVTRLYCYALQQDKQDPRYDFTPIVIDSPAESFVTIGDNILIKMEKLAEYILQQKLGYGRTLILAGAHWQAIHIMVQENSIVIIDCDSIRLENTFYMNYGFLLQRLLQSGRNISLYYNANTLQNGRFGCKVFALYAARAIAQQPGLINEIISQDYQTNVPKGFPNWAASNPQVQCYAVQMPGRMNFVMQSLRQLPAQNMQQKDGVSLSLAQKVEKHTTTNMFGKKINNTINDKHHEMGKRLFSYVLTIAQQTPQIDDFNKCLVENTQQFSLDDCVESKEEAFSKTNIQTKIIYDIQQKVLPQPDNTRLNP